MLRTKLWWDVGKVKNASSHVFWHTTAGPVATADLVALANLIHTQWVSTLAPQTPNNVKLTEVEAEDLGHPATIPGAWGGSSAGTYPTTAQTAEVATLVNFVIARRYRGGKPRVYLPMGVSAQLQDPVTWQTTFVSAVNAAWANFVAGVIGGAGPSYAIDKQVSVSYYTGHALRPSPVVDDVVSASVNPIPASQRRRMGR